MHAPQDFPGAAVIRSLALPPAWRIAAASKASLSSFRHKREARRRLAAARSAASTNASVGWVAPGRRPDSTRARILPKQIQIANLLSLFSGIGGFKGLRPKKLKFFLLTELAAGCEPEHFKQPKLLVSAQARRSSERDSVNPKTNRNKILFLSRQFAIDRERRSSTALTWNVLRGRPEEPMRSARVAPMALKGGYHGQRAHQRRCGQG